MSLVESPELAHASGKARDLPWRVALVEDDVELRDAILVPGLTDAGFRVAPLGSAAELYRAMLNQTFDLVVLDVGLPDESGFEVARHLRTGSSIGIVILTGRGGEREHVQGLGVGADVFLAKPVALDVLSATLHSLTRRLARAHDGVAREHEDRWSLDPDGWSLRAPDGTRVDLTLSERAVLRVLFDVAGQPVSRESLIAGLIDDAYDFDMHRLEMLVHRLRRKVLATTGRPLPLRAVRGRGYLLALARPARH